MPTPPDILSTALAHATLSGNVPIVTDPAALVDAELISRSPQNRAPVRLVLACALAKAHRPELDIRKPYTEIGGSDAFSGRTYDEQYLGPFLSQNTLPVNDTTAFLTPALRNRNAVLTPDTNLVGRPPAVYRAALNLLHAVYREQITAQDLLAELLRWLLILRAERQQRLALLLQTVQSTAAQAVPLSAEEIVTLAEQHLRSPGSSRLPVLLVAAAYKAGGALLGERALPLQSHNAADRQTGSVGDVEVTLTGDDSIVTGYETKARRVTQGDIDIALNKILGRASVQNYVFITTEPIERDVREYANSLYVQTGGIEIAVLDCITFLRHFLHLFHRRRAAFLEAYQTLLLAQPDSAVGQPLKETWLALRQAAEVRTADPSQD